MPPKVQKKKNNKRKKQAVPFPDQITQWIGTPSSLVVHTIFFLLCFFLIFIGFDAGQVMLVLTTIVSLEAIYLSIFIQITVNRNIQSLKEVEEDISEIQEDVEELTEDIGEIQEEVQELGEELEEDAEKEAETDKGMQASLKKLETSLGKVLEEIGEYHDEKKRESGKEWEKK